MTALSHYRTVVAPEWIDYNGHMSEAFYVLVFGYATDTAMDALGMDAAYRGRTGCSLYTVEAHVRYLHEIGLGAELAVATYVVGGAAKKLHLAHTLHCEETLLATEEILGLHVDQARGGATAMPADVRARVEGALTPAPDWCGRAVGI